MSCLFFYPDLYLANKKAYYLVIFYMAINIICFFCSFTFAILMFGISLLLKKIFKNEKNKEEDEENVKNYENEDFYSKNNFSED
jgi:hypothetical protein